MRPAIGARSATGGAAACAKMLRGEEKMSSARETMKRSVFIGTREYHDGGGQAVDGRWIPFFLTPATFSVLESRSPQDIGGRGFFVMKGARPISRTIEACAADRKEDPDAR